MKIACRISNAEWQVMKVLWQEFPLAASSIVEQIKPESEWSPKTIQTLIGRLVKKGILGVNKESSAYRYYPLVSQEGCRREETKSFLQKVYDGSFPMLLLNFVRDENLSAKEIHELKKLLDEAIKRT